MFQSPCFYGFCLGGFIWGSALLPGVMVWILASKFAFFSSITKAIPPLVSSYSLFHIVSILSFPFRSPVVAALPLMFSDAILMPGFGPSMFLLESSCFGVGVGCGISIAFRAPDLPSFEVSSASGCVGRDWGLVAVSQLLGCLVLSSPDVSLSRVSTPDTHPGLCLCPSAVLRDLIGTVVESGFCVVVVVHVWLTPNGTWCFTFPVGDVFHVHDMLT